MKAHRSCLEVLIDRWIPWLALAGLRSWLAGALVVGCAGMAVAQQVIQVELESITVEPPGREAELLVHRYLPLRVGQMVDPEQLVQASDQLAATGLFTEVEIYTKPGSRPGAVNAIVAAIPSHRFRLETGLGFEPLGGWFLNIVGVRRTGLFDRGGTARLNLRTGLRSSGLYGELKVPGLLPSHLDLLLNLDSFSEVWYVHDGDEAYYQDIERSRILLGAIRRLRPDTEIVFRTGYSWASPGTRLDAHDDSPSIPADSLLPAYKDPLRFLNLEGEVHRDRRDRLRPWQSGSWMGLAVRGAAPDHGPLFWGGEVDLRAARPVAGTRAAAVRFRAAYSDPGTPYFLRPIAGGIGSLRGFPSASLSGPSGARALWQISAEWRHPLAGNDPYRPRIIGTVFADAGDQWTDGRHFGFSSSVGYGLLIRVPWIETLNLEVAYPLTDDPTNGALQIGISLGRSF